MRGTVSLAGFALRRSPAGFSIAFLTSGFSEGGSSEALRDYRELAASSGLFAMGGELLIQFL